MRALSIRQPYVELILSHAKRQECRTWTTSHRGPLLLHASKTVTQDQRRRARKRGMDFDELTRGALVGVTELVDCVATREGFAWELKNTRRFLEPIPFSGAVGIFVVDDELVEDAIAMSKRDPVQITRALFNRLFWRRNGCR